MITASNDLEYIDNRKHYYRERKLPGIGVTVKIGRDVENRFPTFLSDLALDLMNAIQVLPPSVHSLIKRTNIWVNSNYKYGPVEDPQELIHSAVHHDVEWLVLARDNPEKVYGVEIYNCSEYQRSRLHWNGCGLILHELCHLIHQFVVPDGLSNESIRSMFTSSKLNGKYKQVYRRDWAGKDVECDMAYALINHKEFFAEMSVSFLCKAYEDLSDELDICAYNPIVKVTPPISSPLVFALLQKKYGRHACIHLRPPESPETSDDEHDCNAESSYLQEYTLRKYLMMCFINKDDAPICSREAKSFCNKFFPFTSNQLQRYDYQLYQDMASLWNTIGSWDDDYEDEVDLVSTLFCLS